MVADEALDEIKTSVAAMNMKQRYEIECKKNDIYFSFPYQVGVMFDESNKEVQRRWVEITMVYHVLKGAKEMADRNEQIPMNIGLDPDYQEKFSICNYRFIKEFTQNQQTDWIVNKINHFKPIDLMEQKDWFVDGDVVALQRFISSTAITATRWHLLIQIMSQSDNNNKKMFLKSCFLCLLLTGNPGCVLWTLLPTEDTLKLGKGTINRQLIRTDQNLMNYVSNFKKSLR